jgi:hypothetical protein
MSGTLTGLRENISSAPIAASKPAKSWTPLRFAPLRYQGNPNPLQNRRLSESQIQQFVQASVDDPSTLSCKIEWDMNCFVVRFPSNNDEHHDSDSICFVPYDARKEFSSSDGEVDEAWSVFVAQIESVWEKMEQRFRIAVRRGDCRILARCDRPHAARFTEISSDMFALYRVIDWKNGIAETSAGDRLYDIHVVAKDLLSEIVTAPAKTSTEDRKAKQSARIEEKPQTRIEEKLEIETTTEAKTEEPAHKLRSDVKLNKMLYSVNDVVEVTGIKRSSLYKYMSDKKLRYRMHGTTRKFTPEDVADFLNQLPKP